MGILQKAGSMMNNSKQSGPINNALSNYDNKVTETESGKAGFTSKIGGLLSAVSSGKISSLKDAASQLTSNLNSSIGSFMNDKIAKLNELASGVASKFGLSDALGKLQGFASSYLSNTIGMLSDMKDDAIKQLQNAATNYITNIVEDFENKLESTLFIPDKIFCESIKDLYYAGADLAYNNHYLRKQCLKNDWYQTLEFVDKQYDIQYSINYSELEADLSICTRNTCWNNTLYIYKKMYNEYENIKSVANINKSRADEIEIKNPDKFQYNANWKIYINAYNENIETMKSIEKMMNNHLKELIVESTTYLDPSAVRKFFSKFPEILKPSNFGENGLYQFTSVDINRMLPATSKKNYDETESDKDYLTNDNNNMAKLQEKVNNISYDSTVNPLTSVDNSITVAKSAIAQFRKNTLDNQVANNKTLSNTAIKKGSNGVYTASAARYRAKGQNSPKNSVKYRKNNIGTALENNFADDTEYVYPKNLNIKKIFVLLSSEVIFGENRMIHEEFYNRCKIPSMTKLIESADKAKGIIGTSYFVQSMFELSNAIDSSAYRYLKKVEDYLFNPAKNMDLRTFANSVALEFNPEIGSIQKVEIPNAYDNTDDIETETSSDYDYYKDGPITSDSNHGSNPETEQILTSELDANYEAKYKTISSIRYISNIPMVAKRDTIIKWLTLFYNAMEARKYTNKGTIFATLCKYVFGKININSAEKLIPIFEYSTNKSLNDNCKNLIAIINLNKTEQVLKISNHENKDEIVRVFNTFVQLFARNISTLGFTQSLFLYDKEYLASHLKTLYTNEINYLKSINNKNNPLYKGFYNYKDDMTKIFTGFDRGGILGYNDIANRVQYTNIETGDWLSIGITSSGTFFGGSSNTKNNGILKLDEENAKLVKTNITSGDWTDIFEYFGTTFFIKNNDEIWYWNGVKIVYSGTNDFSDYDVIPVNRVEKIVLCSKSNKGFKYWNSKTNKFVNGSIIGGKWEIKPISNAFVIFSRVGNGTVYILSGTGEFKETTITDICTDIAYTTRYDHSLVSVSVEGGGNNSGNTGEPISLDVNEYYMFVLVGTVNGLYEIVDKSENNQHNFETFITRRSTALNWSGLVIPCQYSNSVTQFITNNAIRKVTFKTSRDSLVAFNQNNSNILIVDKNELLKQYVNNIKYYEILKDRVYYTVYYNPSDDPDEPDDEDITYLFNKHILNNITMLDTYLDEHEFSFFYIENDLYAKRNINNKLLGLYIFKPDGSYSSVTNIDVSSTGWVVTKIGNHAFITNNESSKGIKTFDYQTGIVTNTNITTGHWKFAESGDFIYALSINGTNSGVKRSNKNDISFIDFTSNPIRYGDFDAVAFDSEKDKIYFGQNRTKCILNINAINYDIDEFIFTKDYYQLQKIINRLETRKSESIAETITEKLTISSDSGSSEGSGSSSGSGSGSGSDSPSLSKEQLFDLLDITDSVVEAMEEISYSSEQSSNIYQNLISYAQAKEAFELDNEEDYDNIILDFIYNYDYASDGLDYKSSVQTAVCRFQSGKSKYLIFKDDDSHDSLSDDFLDSDPAPNDDK